jgi:threonine aldolase
MKVVDLRSDTVTLPTPEMRRAMADAECGDDVLGDDPTVQRLERMAAQRVGKEAALFTPSGTMSNLLSVLAWCQRGEEVIVGSEAHMLWHELGGSSALTGAIFRSVPNDAEGRLDPQQVEATIRPPGLYNPRTGLVCLENTHNRCSGAVLTPEDTAAVARAAHGHNIPVHLDGARIFNAAVALGLPAQAFTAEVDSVCFCISKGLSAPVGSLLCGPGEFIARARRGRRMVGGGMRQAGIIAAAGIVALESMVERLAEDHELAKRLAQGMARVPGVRLDPERVRTNIVIFEWTGGQVQEFMQRLAAKGVKASSPGGAKIRLVTHHGIGPQDIDDALEVIEAVAAVALKVRA